MWPVLLENMAHFLTGTLLNYDTELFCTSSLIVYSMVERAFVLMLISFHSLGYPSLTLPHSLGYPVLMFPHSLGYLVLIVFSLGYIVLTAFYKPIL